MSEVLMSLAPELLDADGRPSVATFVMMTHHGLRRDLARFQRALTEGPRDADLLREEWHRYHQTLQGHHEAEDTRLFPQLLEEHPELDGVITQLTEDHHHLVLTLGLGDRAFRQGETREVIRVLQELHELLPPHLAKEEAVIIPVLRGMVGFPPPQTDEEAEMYAQGFAWTAQGISPDILDKVYASLPGNVLSRLPAALQAFHTRCERVWGPVHPGSARTPIPEQ
jgi:hemerythrin-like domain-containing protein